ncbi:MFS transporter [Streptomyces sp. LP05-1]|uniref:MFS transporter n=1 Tax=Streptomyces pyxinae TaxID=2970734 RepID=A0ABT2CEZ9_9ACTN|nr:MFS transporter [Streptomyces sp. LP05-1]
MSGPALTPAEFALAGSAVDAASLLAGITVSAAAGGPVVGVLLDRAERPGRLLAGALLLYAVGLGAVLAGLGRLPFAVTLLVAVVAGLTGPALSGGWTAQLPRVVAGDRLPRATALDAMTFSAASLAGPALAGGVAELLGARSAVVVSVGLIALALPAAWRLPARPGRERGARPTEAGRERGARPASVAGDLAAGLRAVAGRPSLARATATSVVCCVAQGMLTACLPLLGERALGGAGRGALLLSGPAVSALLAGAVLARFPRSVAPDTVIWAGAAVQAAALALAVTGRPTALVAAVLLAGAGEGPQLAALFAVRHREAPDRLRGQIFTTGASMKITGFAVGASVAGPVAARSLPGALALAAGVAGLAVLVFFAIPSASAIRPAAGPTGD